MVRNYQVLIEKKMGNQIGVKSAAKNFLKSWEIERVKKRSAETCKNISKSKSGEKHPLFGKNVLNKLKGK